MDVAAVAVAVATQAAAVAPSGRSEDSAFTGSTTCSSDGAVVQGFSGTETECGTPQTLSRGVNYENRELLFFPWGHAMYSRLLART